MSFSGLIIPLPIGTGGLTGTHSMSQVGLDKLIVAQNLTYENGTLQKEGGATKYNSAAMTGAPTILGGYDWWPTTSLQRMVTFASDGTLKKDSGAGTFPVTLASGLSIVNGPVTTVPVFVEGGQEALANNSKLFVFTGANQLKVLAADGATVANVALPPADWSAQFPNCGCLHNNRMWGALGHRLYYSQFTNHEDFADVTNAGTLAVYPGEGERIVAIASYKGALIVAKYPRGMYVVNTTDPTVANWSVKRLSGPIGIAGSGCMINIGDDLLLLDPAGVFHLLSSTFEFGDMGLDTASRAARMDTFLADNCILNRLQNAQGVFYPAKREVHFAVTKSGTINNGRLGVDLNQTGLLRWRFSDRDINESLWLRKDTNNIPRLMMGDASGFVYQ